MEWEHWDGQTDTLRSRALWQGQAGSPQTHSGRTRCCPEAAAGTKQGVNLWLGAKQCLHAIQATPVQCKHHHCNKAEGLVLADNNLQQGVSRSRACTEGCSCSSLLGGRGGACACSRVWGRRPGHQILSFNLLMPCSITLAGVGFSL